MTASPALKGADDVTLLPPVITNSVVKNPGKGWVLYSRGQTLDRYSSCALALASVAVWRWEWAEIEPGENTFNWRPIDEALSQCARYGLKCNFSIQAANSTSLRAYVTPKWVFDAGAKGTQVPQPKPPHNIPIATNQVIPVFDDPIFLAKSRAFIKALAARYDGNPHIECIDIRSYGNWGELNLTPWSSLVGMRDIQPAKLREHIQMHLDAFHRTPVCLPMGGPAYDEVYDWAAGTGVWMRDDAVCGTSDGHITRVCLGRAPAIFEYGADYAQLKQIGWWDGRQTSAGVGYAFSQCVDHGCPTYAPLGLASWDTPRFLQDEPEMVIRLSNRLGYHFVLRRAGVPTRLFSGEPVRLQLRWENLGVAPIYIPCFLGVALIDDTGAVASVCFPDGSKPANWKPGTVVNEDVLVNFAPVQVGRYRLALGLFEHLGDIQPTFRLGNDMELVNGWHILTPVVVEPGERAP